MPTHTRPPVDQQLAHVAALLDAAHTAITVRLDAAPDSFDFESLALGVLLARGHAANLIQDDRQRGDAPAPEASSVTDLLAAAAAECRDLPPPETREGLSGLIVEVSDLLREARDLGV